MMLKSNLAFAHTADYQYIEAALRARWRPFLELSAEFHAFVPRSVSDYAVHRSQELDRLKALNPGSTDESLLTIIDGQITAATRPGMEQHYTFDDRVMSEYVTVAFLAHALSEAAINAFLAIGLAAAGTPELFSLLERGDVKEKWLTGPKAFHPSHSLPKGSALFETLQHLIRQRNALVHYKIDLEVDGVKAIEGSRLDRAPLHAQLDWIRRFFSLPYDLAEHAHRQIQKHPGLLLYDSGPIQRYARHAA